MHQRSLSELQGVSPRRGVSTCRTTPDQDRCSSRLRRGSGCCPCPPRGAPLWAWLLLAALLVPGARSFLSEEQEELLVELHNHYRGQVSPSAAAMLPLKWDPSLKVIAEGYAARCIWNHNPELEDTGENLYSSTGKLDLREAVEKWFLEHLYYDFQNNSCDEDQMCGHYTQMVWADTHRLGCAFHLCNSMKGLDWERVSFLVCNYYPAGNYEGMRPFVEGDWCSRCPENLQKCENNLCVADTEDEEEEQSEELDDWDATAFPTTEPTLQPAEEEEEEEEVVTVVPPPAATESDIQPPSSSTSSPDQETPAPGTLPPLLPSAPWGEEEEKEEATEEKVEEKEEAIEEKVEEKEEKRREPAGKTKGKDVSQKIYVKKEPTASGSGGLSAPPALLLCLILTLRL